MNQLTQTTTCRDVVPVLVLAVASQAEQVDTAVLALDQAVTPLLGLECAVVVDGIAAVIFVS